MSRARRPVIGLLVNTVFDGYEEAIWRSVVGAAEEFDADLLCYLGGALAVDTRSTALFDLVHRDNVDGLVVVAGSVGWFAGPAEVAAQLARTGNVPTVSLSEPLAGFPRIVVENGVGISRLVEHLARDHGRRRIAFLGGPPKNSDAMERLQGYRDGLKNAGLEYDPALVEHCDFMFAMARAAVHTLLEERRVPFDALVAANDAMALAALRELRRRGLDVPVCGFDDIADSVASEPPLTTARQPLQEMGREAVRLVLAMLHGEAVPEETRFPAQLVLRQSCGCTRLGDDVSTGPPPATPAVLAQELFREFADFGRRINVPSWAEWLAEAVFLRPAPGAPEPLIVELERLLGAGLEAVPEPAPWLRIARRLLSALPAADLEPGRSVALAADAHALVASLATAAQLSRRVRTDQEARILRWLVSPFPLDEKEFTDYLLRDLHGLGVRSFFFSRYVSSEQREAALVAHFDADGIAELEESPSTFAPQRLIPGRFTGLRRRAHAVLPVTAPHGLIGFALCEIGALSCPSYEVLMHQLSSVFSVTGLMAEVHENHKQLLDSARQAGMAEVAMGALHNIGNLLTSVTVSAEEIRAAAGDLGLSGLGKAAALVAEHSGDLPGFFAADPRARLLPTYLVKATSNLTTGVEHIQAEAIELLERTGLVRESIRSLQEVARGGHEHRHPEAIDLPVVTKAALEIQRANLEKHGVEVRQELDPVPPFVGHRAKFVDVLVNLVKNGVEAMREVPEGRRRLVVRARRHDDGRIRLDVQDSGEGILPENLASIFRYGFTTKRDGHGFGLHTCAIYMKQMGGEIAVSSDGLGRGTTFTLWLDPSRHRK